MSADESFALTDYKVIIFDCYGTLCDWESGIYEALLPLLYRNRESAGTWTRKETLLKFTEIEKDLQDKDPSVLYADLLSNAHAALTASLGESELSNEEEHAVFGASVRDWALFPDTVDALRVLERHYKLVILSNVDHASFAYTHAKLSGATRAELAAYTRPPSAKRWLPNASPDGNSKSPFSLILTAQDTGAYKPDPRGMLSALEIIDEQFGVKKEEVLVVAQSLFHDIDASSKLGVSGVWIDREGAVMGLESLESGDPPKWKRRYRTLGEMAEAVEAEVE
ncbi:hypothetical protein HMN09_00539400 [Mycena chlorophos]|uniref:HAD-like protein n=1 Tax=Mycena chlorophos TaxID=658473 RepID=A0A8H6T808_MYCCL|nr:hypothetical protein HMN09_00539400 [Mycena chlorophos]